MKDTQISINFNANDTCYFMYYQRFNKIPSKKYFNRVDIFNNLKNKKLKINASSITEALDFFKNLGYNIFYEEDGFLCLLKNKTFITLDIFEHTDEIGINAYYDYDNKIDDEDKIIEYISKFIVEIKPRISTINFSKNGGEFYLKSSNIDPVNLSPLDTYYGDGFEEKYEQIKKVIINNNKGAIFLHGTHGTGKTTLIRQLIHDLYQQKDFVYVPNTIIPHISNPDFLSFLTNRNEINPQLLKVLIVEDAEDVLRTRDDGNPLVSTILNSSDGLLSDVLKIQWIFTFNAGKAKLDPALLRQGRTLASHCFEKLSPQKANEIFKIHNKDNTTDKEMSLAEIFSIINDSQYDTLVKDLQKPSINNIGFKK